jgi:hypothetical protein
MVIAATKGLDEDKFYDEQMILIRHFLPELLEYIKTLQKAEEAV